LLNSTNGAPIALLKTNAGSLTMDGVNTYGNGTTLAGGSLIVNGTLPAGTFAISTGTTLGGRGVIYPTVTIPSGATLAPGGSIGTLTVSNNLTLQASSTTRMEISKSAVHE
jgi:fibronectin-binding autotransporter adhesin